MKKIFALLMISLLLFSCNNNVNNKETWKEVKINDSSKIYTSIYPIYFITKSLVWDYNVINLVPDWWEPHEFEPNLKQISEINNSKLVILNWLWIEWYSQKLDEIAKNTIIYKISDKLDNLIKDKNWNFDPHIWLSPKIMKKISEDLEIKLEKEWFISLNKDIITKLDNLDKKFTKELSNCKRKKIITSHIAFAYLARDYWFTQYAILWISPEQEPTAKNIANVVDLIKKEKISIIFWEELISPKFTDTLKIETNTEVLNLNPLETLTPEQEKIWENYITIMEKNLEYLKKWLECE